MPSLQVKTDTGWLDITGGGSSEPPVVVEPYVRPADWLALPTVLDTDCVLTGLVAIFPTDNNFLALSAGVSYTVDWGDGSAPGDLLPGQLAYHQYTYSDISPTTACSRGYRQVIVTITPRAPGTNLQGISLAVKHNQAALATYAQPWLDIITSPGPSVSSMILRNNTMIMSMLEQVIVKGALPLTSAISAYFLAGCAQLQRVEFDTSQMTNLNSMFSGCRKLQSVPQFNTPLVNNVGSMFLGCISLREVPLFDTSHVGGVLNGMASMFQQCVSLRTVPLFDTSNVTSSLTSMFSGSGITSLPNLDTSKVTGMSSMFQACPNLVVGPMLNTAAVKSFTGMFSNSGNLSTVPLYDTSSGTTMSQMFQTCSGLTVVPLFDTSAVTDMSNMFNGCSSLQSVPLFDTSSVTAMASTFSGCSSLVSVPLFDTSSVTTMASTFTNSTRLRTIPPFNTAAVTVATNVISTCTSLGVGRLEGTKVAISYSGCSLSTAAIVDVIDGLANLTGFPTQTVTFSSNWGYAALTPAQKAVATGKNWTVV